MDFFINKNLFIIFDRKFIYFVYDENGIFNQFLVKNRNNKATLHNENILFVKFLFFKSVNSNILFIKCKSSCYEFKLKMFSKHKYTDKW